jgi:hypothetical protein
MHTGSSALTLALALAAAPGCTPALAQDNRKAAEDTYRDIHATLGVVPGFFGVVPDLAPWPSLDVIAGLVVSGLLPMGRTSDCFASANSGQ